MKTISQVKRKFNRTIITWFCIFIIILVLCWSIIFWQHNKDNQNLRRQQLHSNILVYTSNLSDKLNLIASSPAFISFLKSGEATRKNLYPDVMLEILSLSDKSIVGMKIVSDTSPYLRGIFNAQHKVILRSGNTSTAYNITLRLCYLDNSLNTQYGLCNNDWILYFSKHEIIKSLKDINPRIEMCSSGNCPLINLIAPTKKGYFGSFPIKSISSMPVRLQVGESSIALTLLTLGISIVLFFALIIIIRFKTNKIVNKAFADPIDSMIKTLKAGKIPQGKDYIEELDYLAFQVKQYNAQKDKIEIAKVAEQVAHDIRSPIVALETLLKHLKGLPEDKITIMRNSVNQIRDIANNLLHHKDELIDRTQSAKSIMLTPSVHYVVSEKRNEFENSQIQVNLAIEESVETAFILATPTDLKRVLSNVINNAYQALPDKRKSKIDITVYSESGNAYIKISDNGCGIPHDKLTEIFKEGVSFKKQGSGLGLYHAKKTINEWGGNISIISKIGQGTDVLIVLPLQPAPFWFADHLSLVKQSLVVIVDDSESIYNIWQQRFAHILNRGPKLKYFNSPSSFLKWYQDKSIDIPISSVFLIDFEFPEKANGLDLIEQMDYYHQKYLVTSRGEEFSTTPEYIKKCEQYDFTVIPKFYCNHIPLNLVEEPDIILVEPEELICKAWEVRAKKLRKQIKTYTIPNSFMNDFRLYNRDTPLYIAIEHISLAEKLKRCGFMNVTVISYDDKIKSAGFHIVSKSYPFSFD